MNHRAQGKLRQRRAKTSFYGAQERELPFTVFPSLMSSVSSWVVFFCFVCLSSFESLAQVSFNSISGQG